MEQSEIETQNTFCPACKSENDADANFCDICGTSLQPILICYYCKAENDEQAKFCDQCGKPLDTPEYRKKERIKLGIGLMMLAIFFLGLSLVTVWQLWKGTFPFGHSTKDGVWTKMVDQNYWNSPLKK